MDGSTEKSKYLDYRAKVLGKKLDKLIEKEVEMYAEKFGKLTEEDKYILYGFLDIAKPRLSLIQAIMKNSIEE